MSRRLMMLTFLVCAFVSPARADRPIRFSVGLGASRIGLKGELGPAPVGMAVLVSTDAKLISGFRLRVESTHVRFTRDVGTSMQVLQADRDVTGATSAMATLEWQPPERSVWGPYIHVATGVMRIAEGDMRGVDINAGWFTDQGESRTVPAWAAGVGVRKDPRSGGKGPFVDSRYLWTVELAEQRVHQMQLLAGVTF